MKKTKTQFLAILLLLISPLLFLGCADAEAEEEEENIIQLNFNEIGIDPPADWNVYYEIGRYCLYLPKSFKQVAPVNNSLRQFQGPMGTVSVMYSRLSTGVHRPKNATVNGKDVAVTLTVPIQDFPAYYGAEMVYSFHSNAVNPFFFDIVFYADKLKHEDVALKIFGAARPTEDCIPEDS